MAEREKLINEQREHALKEIARELGLNKKRDAKGVRIKVTGPMIVKEVTKLLAQRDALLEERTKLLEKRTKLLEHRKELREMLKETQEERDRALRGETGEAGEAGEAGEVGEGGGEAEW